MIDKLQNLSVETVIGILVSLVGVYISLSTRRKNNSDAAQTITNAAKTIVEMNQEELSRLRVEDVSHENYINYLLIGIAKLHKQIRKLKQRPSFSPIPFTLFIEKEKTVH